MEKKRITVLIFLAILLTALPVWTFPAAAQFSADLTLAEPDKTMEGKIYVKENTYRMEIQEKGQPIIVIVDGQAGLTRVLIPSSKMFFEMENKDPRSMMNNPFQAFRFSSSRYETQPVGKEKVNGYNCTKMLVKAQGKTIMTAWVAEEFGFPIKIVNHQSKGRFVELKNIREGSLDDGLFQTPAGYAKMDRMPVPPPAWAGAVPGAPRLSAPFEKTLSSNQIVRVPLKPGQRIRVQGKNLSDGKAAFTAVAFKSGRPVKDPSFSTFNMSRKAQGMSVTPKETGTEADEIVIRVREGRVLIKTVLVEAPADMVHVRSEQPEKAGSIPAAGQKPGNQTKLRTAGIQSAPSSEKESGISKTQVPRKPAPDQPSMTSTNDTAPVAIMFILDASGSMWGKVEGTAKISIAKEVMSELIRDLPEGADTGIVAYGHRRKGDCNDVEELVPLQTLNRKNLIEKIRDISPKGKTPITLSVQKTAEKLRTVEDETVIILVSDGKETCGGDPCALVRKLKEAGIKFIMHVIGFDVTDEERQQLECMAKEGGGQYFTAKTAQEFRVAAKTVVKESQNIGYLKITALRNGQPASAHMEVFPQGQKQSIKSGSTGTDPDRPGAKLKPGVYDVMVFDRKTAKAPQIKLEGIAVEAGKTTEREVDFSSGTLRLSVLKQGKPSFAWVRVNKAGTESEVISSDTSVHNPLILYLIPGTYDVIVTDDRIKPPQRIVFSNVTITAGGIVEKKADFSEGRLSVEVLVNGEKDTVSLYVYEAGTEKSVASGDTSRDNPKTLKLKPGVYDLKVVYRKSKPETKLRFDGIEIKAGQTVEKRAQFGHGLLSIQVLVNGKKGSASLYICAPGTDKRVATGDTSRDNPKTFKLNAGAYDLKVVYRKATPETEQAFKGIEIVTNQTVERRAQFEEGTLEIRTTSGGRTVKGDFKLFHPGEKRRFGTKNANRKIRMKPGDYEALVRAYKLPGKPEKRVSISIQAGQTTTLDVNFKQE